MEGENAIKNKKKTKKSTRREDFNTIVADILENNDVQQLNNFRHHYKTTRLHHSISVAYASYRVCRFFGWDYVSAARGGMLHDLFLYDWRTTDLGDEKHAFKHPKIALENARNNFTLNSMEEDIIVKHMWPLTIRLPRYKESFVVSFMDKLCASYEIGSHVYTFNLLKIKFLIDLIGKINQGGI